MKNIYLISTSLLFSVIANISVANDYYPSFPSVFSERIADDEWCMYKDEWYSHGAEVSMNGVNRVCILENPYDRDFRRMIWKTKKSLSNKVQRSSSKSGRSSLMIKPVSR